MCVGDKRSSMGSFIAVGAGSHLFLKTLGMIYHKDCFVYC